MGREYDDSKPPEPDENDVVQEEQSPESQHGIIESLKGLISEFLSTLDTGRKLLAAEARLFLHSLFLIFVLAVAVGFLVAAIWGFLGAAAAFFMVRHMAVDPVISLLIVASALLVLTAALGAWIYRLTSNLKFRHSRQALAKFVTPSKRKEKEEQAP